MSCCNHVLEDMPYTLSCGYAQGVHGGYDGYDGYDGGGEVEYLSPG